MKIFRTIKEYVTLSEEAKLYLKFYVTAKLFVNKEVKKVRI